MTSNRSHHTARAADAGHRSRAVTRKLTPTLAVTVLLTTIVSAKGSAQDDGLPGEELAFNSTAAGRQVTPDIVVEDDGSAVVVWQTRNPADPTAQGIAARALGPDSNLSMESLLVSDGPLRRQPAIARLADGSVTVTWIEDLGPAARVMAQRFDDSLTPIEAPFIVSNAAGPHYGPQVASTGTQFVVVWESRLGSAAGNRISARRFDGSGPLGEGFPIDEAGASCDMDPAVAPTSDGGFVVSWTDDRSSGAPEVLARRFSPDDVALGGAFQVNSWTTSAQQTPDVAVDGDDRFVVVWASHGPDGSGAGVYGQRYDADGFPVAGEFRINDRARSSQLDPGIAMDADGNALVTWQNFIEGGEDLSIYGRRISGDGTLVGDEFQINSWTTGAQTQPALHVSALGEAIAVWRSDGQDGDLEGIFGQRVELSRTSPLLGPAQQISEQFGEGHRRPIVATTDTGHSLVVWPFEETAATQLAARAIEPEGNSGIELAFPQSEGSSSPAALGLHSSFVVAWSEYRSSPLPEQTLRIATLDQHGDLATTVEIDAGPLVHQPALAAIPNDEFVVAWRKVTQIGTPERLVVQHFRSDGTAVDGPVDVAEVEPNSQFLRTQEMAATATGDLLLVWQATNPRRVMARRLNAAGDMLPAMRIDGGQNSPSTPRVSRLEDGSFVVAWNNLPGSGESPELYVREFSASGAPLQDPILVARGASGHQLSVDRHGRALVAWQEQVSLLEGRALAREILGDGALGEPFQVSESLYADSLGASAGTHFQFAWRNPVANGGGANHVMVQRVRPGHAAAASNLVSLPAPRPVGTIRPGRAVPGATFDP